MLDAVENPLQRQRQFNGWVPGYAGNLRVGQMVEDGLVGEVKRLLEAGYGPDDPGMTGAGYREIIRYLQGELTLDQATEEIRNSHRRYARRQTTWFRHQLPAGAIEITEEEIGEDVIDQIVGRWKNRQGREAE